MFLHALPAPHSGDDDDDATTMLPLVALVLPGRTDSLAVPLCVHCFAYSAPAAAHVADGGRSNVPQRSHLSLLFTTPPSTTIIHSPTMQLIRLRPLVAARPTAMRQFSVSATARLTKAEKAMLEEDRNAVG